jgi:hypothetical protein
MIKIIQLFELPIVCGALLKARSCLFGLSFLYPFKKANMQIAKKMSRRIALLLSGWQVVGLKS